MTAAAQAAAAAAQTATAVAHMQKAAAAVARHPTPARPMEAVTSRPASIGIAMAMALLAPVELRTPGGPWGGNSLQGAGSSPRAVSGHVSGCALRPVSPPTALLFAPCPRAAPYRSHAPSLPGPRQAARGPSRPRSSRPSPPRPSAAPRVPETARVWTCRRRAVPKSGIHHRARSGTARRAARAPRGTPSAASAGPLLDGSTNAS